MGRCFNLFPAAVCAMVVFAISACGHIEANVPETQDFAPFLVRDLNAYFTKELKEPVVVDYHLLRDYPTQTGIAYPKYYAWVKVRKGQKLLTSGAVRLAAVDKQAFEVTDFISKEQILKNPEGIKEVFPARLCAGIASTAAAEK